MPPYSSLTKLPLSPHRIWLFCLFLYPILETGPYHHLFRILQSQTPQVAPWYQSEWWRFRFFRSWSRAQLRSHWLASLLSGSQMLAFQMWGHSFAKVWPRKHWPNRVAPTRWVMGFAHASILSSRCVSWVPRGLVLEELVFWESAGLILCRFSSHLGMKKWMAELEKLDHARLHLQFAWSDPRILAALLSSIWKCQRI